MMSLLFLRSIRNALTASAGIAMLTTGLAHAAPALALTTPQASPAPSPSPVPQGPTQTSPRTAGPAPAAPFGHLPVIDIIPIFTDPQFYTVPKIGKNGQPTTNPLVNGKVGYDPVDVGGTFKLPITPNFSAALDRVVEGTLNVPNAAVTNTVTTEGKKTTTTSYPTYSRDSVLVYRLDEQYKRLQIEEGLYFRHRIAGGSSTSDNPLLPTIASTEAHYGYVGLTYVSPGVPWLLNSFLSLNINADTQSVDHHVACLLTTFEGVAATCPKGNKTGAINENKLQDRIWETDQYVQLTVPIDRKHGVNFSAQDKWGALNFYENSPFPYRYTTSQTYLFTKRFNRVFALTLRDRDQWTVQGLPSPYLKPNAQHNGSIDVLADFKVDLNNLH
jgi:hypothetical protein